MSGSMRGQGRQRVRGPAVVVIAAMALVAVIVPVAAPASAAVTVIDRAVAVDADDAEEAIDGSVDLTSGDLELVSDGTRGAQTVGMRFTGLAIPPATTLTDAWVQFQADAAGSTSTSLVIRAEAADSAAAFTTATGNVSSRPRTNAFVPWNPAPWTVVAAAGPDQRTPSLAPVLQEVVNRAGWAANNALAVIISGTGKRTAESFRGGAPPILHVELSAEPPPNSAPTVSAGPDQMVTMPATATLAGAAFDDGLPAGNAVTSAWSQVSGPGTAVFVDPASRTTAVSFTAPGIYTLRLTGSDGELSTSDEMTVDVRAPELVASQVHYSFTGPTSVALDWRGGNGELRYGTTAGYGTTVQAQPPSVTPISSGGPWWEASISGLEPDVSYHYSVDGGPDAVFATPTTGPTRFDAVGDIGSSYSRPRVAAMMASIAADAPSFVLGLGDLTYGDSDGPAAVDQHFNDVMAWSQTAAYMPVWGNHEWESSTDDLRNYKGRFAIPHEQAAVGAPAAGCCGEDWGWFDSAGVRFISFPEPYANTTWTQWSAAAESIMADAQANPAINFIVTFGHRPAYSTGGPGGRVALATALDHYGDTYSKYVLDLNGHAHVYERFAPIHNVTHITAGTGGRSVEATWGSTDPRTAYRAHHLARLRVDVTATSLHVEAVCGPADAEDDTVCADGAVLDSVTIDKPGVFNRAPVVAAGPDGAVVRPALASLAGSVTDDGLPAGNAVTSQWTQVSGPGTATFTDTANPTTTAAFSATGTYVLRLTASDGDLNASDEATVTVSDPVAATLDRAVAIGSDDAEESSATTRVNLSSADLELVTDGTVVQTVGVRFSAISIPRGATITNAYVQFETDETGSAAASLVVRGQAADNATTFTTARLNISSRARTAAAVPWAPAAWPTVQVAGPAQRTPDLSPIIAEITGRSGWASGNALALIITGTGRRTAESFNGTRAPVLHIEYVTT